MLTLARSLLVGSLLAACALPGAAGAADLVNINTADLAALETLPGIGPTKAQAIIDYRSGHGPFATVADVKNVSGIGDATYAEIEPFITVAASTSTGSAGAPDAATSTPTTPSRGSAAVHVPPSALTLSIGGDRQAFVHTPVAFEAAVDIPGGAPDTHATVTWAFGDGAAGAGYASQAVFDRPGTYLVAATAVDGTAAARAMVTVNVAAASVRITSIAPDGIVIENDAAADLDLSGWVLVEGAKNVRLPEGTWLAPAAAVLFPAAATKLALAPSAILAYPDGSIAATYPPAPTRAQPAAVGAGYQGVQTVEPALTSRNAENHDAGPPAGETAGAAVRDASVTVEAAAERPAPAGVLRSRWSLGALVVAALAGGAFLVL